jgi:tRNA pseudouridine55 synthase
MTSHDVVARVRKILGTRRVGHTGTLDPFATGVMVLVLGKATRLARFLDKDFKEYIAEVQFGFETDTGDVTGTPRTNADAGPDFDAGQIDWEPVFEKFRGDIMQTPPMYSAKKIDGKKLYELARKGEEVERKPVLVSIATLELVQDEFRIPHSAIRIRIVCSAGTYIRQLAEDIGREIGIGAHLTSLRRTAAGKFGLEAAVTLDALKDSDKPEEFLRPVEDSVSHLNEFVLHDDRVDATRNGLASRSDSSAYSDGEYVRMTGSRGELIAVGIYSDAEKIVRPKIVLN